MFLSFLKGVMWKKSSKLQNMWEEGRLKLECILKKKLREHNAAIRAVCKSYVGMESQFCMHIILQTTCDQQSFEMQKCLE